MQTLRRSASQTGIIVSDFDGTLTDTDFFELIRKRWPYPPETDPWLQYWRGELTHFEALARIFANLRADPRELEAMSDSVHLADGFAGSVERLRQAGWDLVIASAGCNWYIERLLKIAGVSTTVFANPGTMEPNGALLMRHPEPGPFFSEETGVNKLAITEAALNEFPDRVAFAGDGRPDLAPALLVPPERRFARGWLAQTLTERGEAFHAIQSWSEIPGLLAC